MSDQGWNNPGQPPAPEGGAGWGQQPPPPQSGPPQGGQQWGQQPPPPQGAPPPQSGPPQGGQQWGQQPPGPQGGQQWGQPGQQPVPQGGQQWGQQPGSGGGGLEPNIGAMLSYLLFGWIGGLIMYFTQKHPEVRFHAAQSILLFGPLHLLAIVFGFLGSGFFGIGGGLTGFALFTLLGLLLNLFSFVMWIFMSIQGYQLKHTKLPVIGDMAEQWAVK